MEYSKRFNIAVGTIKYWEYGLNAIPFKELCRIIRLNNLDPYKELIKHKKNLKIGNITLPLKPSQELLDIIKFIIPQKSFNHACVIRKEETNLKANEFKKLINKMETYFNCNVKSNVSTGALYIYSIYLTLFLDTFFNYEKAWLPMTESEINIFCDKMKTLEGGMEEKLPFEKIEREILIKREAETSEEYGKKPEERTIKKLMDYGVVNINKPDGPT